MRSPESELRDRAASFPEALVDPASSLPSVVARGQRLAMMTRAATTAALAVVVGLGTVVVPRMWSAPPAAPVIDAPERQLFDVPVDRDGQSARIANATDRAMLAAVLADHAANERLQEEEFEGDFFEDPPPDAPPPAPAPEPTPAPTPSRKATPTPAPTTTPSPTPSPTATPTPKPTSEPTVRPTDPTVAFTATQDSRSREYDPPYNYYRGTATPGTVIEVDSDHGHARTEADGKGRWEVKVWFEDAPWGTATWPVTVVSSAGDSRTFEFTGTRPRPDATPFTAHQTYGECSEPLPYDEFSGTAPAGSKVFVTSDFGEAYTWADDDGAWWVRVEFPDAPYDEPFTVLVTSRATGEVEDFRFVRRRGDEPHEVAFTAEQLDDEVEHDPPYGRWRGTATPGTRIWIVSEFGGTVTRADADGTWWAKVWFEDAPAGRHTWKVVLESDDDHREAFSFTGIRPSDRPAPHVDFTATIVEQSCHLDEAWQVWTGTAEPGSKVKVRSEYGHVWTHADDEGHWELRIDHVDVPDERIDVLVYSYATEEARWSRFRAREDGRCRGE